MKVHPLADIQTDKVGEGTVFWQFSIVLKGAFIGNNCNINCHTFIENDVTIGNNVTVKSGVFLWDGIEVENNVFIGPNATFTNDKFPRSKQHLHAFQKTILRDGCSIGANATILGGTEVGKYAIVGAGSVVTKNVPSFALVIGNPARVVGWLDEKGHKLTQTDPDRFEDRLGKKYIVKEDKLIQL